MTAIDALDRMIRLTRDWVSDEVSDRTIADAFQNCVVHCVADQQNLAHPAGRDCLVTFVCLIARMGVQVELRIPDVPLIEPQPPLYGGDLTDALVDLGRDLIPGSSVARGASPPDLLFLLGDTPGRRNRVPTWRLTGNEWCGAIGPDERDGMKRWSGAWPVGPLVSAALGASEVFKFVLTGLPLRDSYYLRHLAPALEGTWDFGCSGRARASDLGSLGIISGGAIIQAALFTLLRVPDVRFLGTALDDDVVSLSNLNRNMLNRRRDVSRTKVEVLRDFTVPHVVIDGVFARFDEHQAGRASAPRVIVGVDDIAARWGVQRTSPGWLAVSGTSHFEVSSSSHLPTEACAGCLHPKDDPGTDPLPTVSFVSFWAGLSLAVRLLRDVSGMPYLSDHQHLWLTPLRTELVGRWEPVATRRDCPVGCARSVERRHFLHNARP